MAGITTSVLVEDIPLDIHNKIKRMTDDDRATGKEITIKEKYLELIKKALAA